MSADHRARIGKMRRERTEARILEAAIEIFTERGPDAPVVEDFIRAATISRGTFYNHYSTVQELLHATVEWLCRDLVESIRLELATIDDPLRRMVVGIRLGVRKSVSDPEWFNFIDKVHVSLGSEELRTDLLRGREQGVFHFQDVDVAFDLIDGGLMHWMRRQTRKKRGRGVGEDDLLRTLLRAIGTDPATAERLLAEPPPPMKRVPHTFKAVRARLRAEARAGFPSRE
ncbi:MAG: TetR/AcrR family transcriptional regulator [Steroidobacteraceae bacterium]